MTTAAREMVIKAPELRGASLQLGSCRDTEICLDGPGGTGKTFSILYYIHILLLSYPGSKWLVCRKYNVDLSGSAMATYQNDVLDPYEGVYYYGGSKVKPAGYIYPNGSFMAVSGLDRPSKLKSFECDGVYINEATEIDVNDLEIARMRLRKGVIPWQQIIMDVNPDAPTHWLNIRMNEGKTTRLVSRHEDNPRYFDLKTNDWTEEGRRYIFGVLEGLTGVRYLRYRKGIWAASEGMVYEQWNPTIHVCDRFEISRSWSRYWAIDWGFRNPFVLQCWAESPDGDLYLYREIYMTGVTVENHTKKIMEVTKGEPRPRAIITDHDAEDRATFEQHSGYDTIAAEKAISTGIQEVQNFLGDGKHAPLLHFFRDALIEVDRSLLKSGQPISTIDEIPSYIWDVSNGRKLKEEPLDKYNHSCFIAGTMIATDHGDVAIERIIPGNCVLTRNGYMPVKVAAMTAQSSEVHTVTLSNGATLTGTANHPVYLKGCGYIPLRALRYCDIIEDISSYKERYPLACQSLQQKVKPSCTKGLGSIATLSQRMVQTGTIIAPQVSRHFTKKSGKTRTGLFLMGMISTTETAIHRIMNWTIWSASQQKNTQDIMLRTCLQKRERGDVNWLNVFALLHRHGTSQMRAESGIGLLQQYRGRAESIIPCSVSNVVKSIKPERYKKSIRGFAPIIVSLLGGVGQALTMSREFVRNVEKVSRLTNTAQPNAADLYVVNVCVEAKREAVYNLTVENAVGEGEYFANGILVHNCDAMRYLCMFIARKRNYEIVPMDEDVVQAISGYVGY